MVDPEPSKSSASSPEHTDDEFLAFKKFEPPSPVPPNIAKHRGFVAVLDVLGARDVTDPEGFLKRWDALGEEVKKEAGRTGIGGSYIGLILGVLVGAIVATNTARPEDGVTAAKTVLEEMTEPPLQYRVIADTIVISTDTDGKAGFFLLEQLVSSVFVKGLSYRLFLRGAISFGDFWETEKMLVGPAVSDAFNWHDQMEWIRVALTPSAGYAIESKDAFDGSDWIGSFVRYDVPLKERRVRLYALDWMSGTGAPSRTDLTQSFSEQPIPVKAEAKYRHTLEFFDKVSGTKPPPKWLTKPAGESPPPADRNDRV